MQCCWQNQTGGKPTRQADTGMFSMALQEPASSSYLGVGVLELCHRKRHNLGNRKNSGAEVLDTRVKPHERFTVHQWRLCLFRSFHHPNKIDKIQHQVPYGL